MAKQWYPIVDYTTCVQCGGCIKKCKNNVYDNSKAPSPVVENPENCSDHCHGCGNICPMGSITYLGEDTDWKPPKQKSKKKKLLKLLVPVAMILIVVGIWAFSMDSGSDIVLQQDIPEEWALNATSIDIEQLSEHSLPMIIDFGADECAPCIAMAPVLVELNSEMQGKAIIKFVDVWKNPEAAEGFPIQVIPSQVLYNADGTPYVPSEIIATAINFNMYAHRETGEHIFTVHQGGLSKEQMQLILADMGV